MVNESRLQREGIEHTVAFLVKYLHFTPEYVLSLSPVQIEGYSTATLRLLKMENGTGNEMTPEDRVGQERNGVKGSQNVLLDDEAARIVIAKRDAALKKAKGKDYKMSFFDLTKTGVFQLK